MTGRNLSYVYAAYSAMEYVFGKPLDGADLSAVVLAALDGVPRGVRAMTRTLPYEAYADAYNHAYAVCLDIAEERAREQVLAREW